VKKTGAHEGQELRTLRALPERDVATVTVNAQRGVDSRPAPTLASDVAATEIEVVQQGENAPYVAPRTVGHAHWTIDR
jgi:hypothetical protein